MIEQLLLNIQTAEKTQDRNFVTSLARGLTLLYLIRSCPNGISHNKLCKSSQLPKATVSRLIYTLSQLNLVYQHQENNLYYPGFALIQFMNIKMNSIHTNEAIHALIQNFAIQHNVSVSLGTEQNGEILYLKSIRSPAPITVQLHQGSSISLPDTAIGRAYFCALSTIQQQKLITYLMQEKRITSRQQESLQFYKHFFKKNAYTYSDRDFSNEIIAVAVPINIANSNYPLYAINASIPSYQQNIEDFSKKIIQPLKYLAKEIETFII